MQLSELFAHAGRAAFWGALAKWLDLIGAAVSFLVMVRLIGPEGFGVYGLALLVLIIPETLVGGALSESLIQKQDLRPGHVAATMLVQLGLALALAAAVVALAPAIAAQLGHEELAVMAPLLALTLAPMAAAAAPAALLQREFRFGAIAAVDAAGTLVAATVGIGSALSGLGVWSLVIMECARRLVRALGFFVVVQRSYMAPVCWRDFEELLHFNGASLAVRILAQLDSMAPRFFLGLISATALGYFNVAQRAFQQGSGLFIAPFHAMVLPLASRIQVHREKLHQAIESACRIATLLAYPVFFGASAMAPTFVHLVLGPDWTPATPAIQIMLLLGVRAATASFNGSVLRAVGKPGHHLAIVAVSVSVGALVSPFAAHWGGAAGVAAALLCRDVLTWALGALLLEKAIGYPATRQFAIGWESFVSAFVMAAIVTFAQASHSASVAGPLLALELLGIGVVSYVAVLSFLAPSLMRVVSNIGLALLKRDFSGASAQARILAHVSA